MSRAILFLVLIVASSVSFTAAQAVADTPTPLAELRDGQHDWDFLFGSWKMHLHRMAHPLTGSNDWADFEAYDIARKVWNGRANLDEFEAEGTTGHIEGLTLRLYNPKTHEWSITWANSAKPGIEKPMIGSFNHGRGEFYDQELYHDRSIYVRFVWTNMTENSGDFTQSFSADGGKTWEPNWVTTMQHTDPDPAAIPANPDHHDGQHDFDFEFGSWKAHLKRVVHPLTGSQEWVEYDGTSVVNKIWNGRANIGEFEVKNASSNIEGLSLRLFDPNTHQWNIYWASASDGLLDPTPMVGGFKNGRGEFYAMEPFDGKMVFVRFIFSDLTANSFRLEQAFSADAGKTWEPNWITTFTREKE
jgi:hypothetical protein